MKKSIIACLGCIALTGSIGVGALLSSKQNKNIAKADDGVYVGNIQFYSFTDRVEDIEFNEPDVYWYEGEFFTSNLHFTSMSIDIYEESEDIYKLSKIRVNTGEFAYDIYDREFTYYWDYYHFDEAFKGIDVRVSFGDDYGATILNILWTILPLNEDGETTNFQFANQINYYSPYDVNIGSDFVYDTVFSGTPTVLYVFKTFYQGYFVSGGQLFNVIRARYVNAIGLIYPQDNSSYATWSSNNYASYEQLEYYNTLTQHIEIVNKRDTKSVTYNNGSGMATLKGSTWVSQSYRDITLYGDVSDVTLTNLDKFNNALEGVTGYQGGDNINLGNAFSLIGQAFKTGLPLLSIEIFPGITIGLLLFMPLIAGIIIAIIWIVKR